MSQIQNNDAALCATCRHGRRLHYVSNEIGCHMKYDCKLLEIEILPDAKFTCMMYESTVLCETCKYGKRINCVSECTGCHTTYDCKLLEIEILPDNKFKCKLYEKEEDK